uniref:CRIB domain-containing protein n=1 Tax=Timema cristinae TaxID=61476 RepID=A0A7R9GUU5_TIMCR|nr:unnamed protein product [Timema cristinae]
MDKAVKPFFEQNPGSGVLTGLYRISQMSGYQSGNMAGEIWVQWFSCCINQPAAHQRKRQQQRRSARVRIDRSMIGEPTNFQHTGHIGSGDVDLGNSHLRAIQNQMQSKGGYETAFAVKVISLSFVVLVRMFVIRD